ncbi:hypothetical protein IC617_07575 [Neiella sp. HB171785]|uniref:CRISPR type III-associated protein domain-containing protein n=1 Tax=Neiella litorisoli TaxID=2771431 RepID=A0A8J6ULN3_9GAMM|nr:RAMP superfamily CRISPR-associated protein [Neiella litorisoli]MBD1389280.1 hypothetical protein [Neiella litorisoli]
MSTYLLKLEFLSPWHVGSGLSAGAFADLLVNKDDNQLPIVPGKTLKGILRDALAQADCFGWFDERAGIEQATEQRSTIAELLCGIPDQAANGQGCMTISSASLSAADKALFAANDNDKLLYLNYSQTQIDDKGCAKNMSLRSLEAVIPLTLYAELSFNPSPTNELLQELDYNRVVNTASQWLEKCLPLIRQLGAFRNRGFGDVVVTFEKQ